MFNEELITAKVAARNAGKILMKYFKSSDKKVQMKSKDNPVTCLLYTSPSPRD